MNKARLLIDMYWGPRIHNLKRISRKAQGRQATAHQLGIRLPITIHDFAIDLRGYSAHQIRNIMRQIQRVKAIPDPIRPQLEQQILQSRILTEPVDPTRISSFSSVRSLIMDLQTLYFFAEKAGLPSCMEACRQKAASVISAYTQRAQAATKDVYLSDRRKAGIIKELSAFRDFITGNDMASFAFQYGTLFNLFPPVYDLIATLSSPDFRSPWQQGTLAVSNQEPNVASYLSNIYPEIEPGNLPIEFSSPDLFSSEEMLRLFTSWDQAIGFNTRVGKSVDIKRVIDHLREWAEWTKSVSRVSLKVTLQRVAGSPHLVQVVAYGNKYQRVFETREIGTINLLWIMHEPIKS